MESSIKARLEALVGTTVHYEKQNVKIEKFKEIAGNICIVTDVRSFQFYPNEIEESFLNKILPPKTPGTYTPPSVLEKKAFVELPAENISIKTTLMEALDKVKTDPSFLNQAKSICEITNTIVNVQKLEIEMIKLQKDL